MLKKENPKNMNHFAFFFTVLLSIQGSSLLANSFWCNECWHGVCGIESGVAITSNAGKSKTFPSNSSNEEFYEYSVHHKTQTRGIYGGFIGAVWRGQPCWDIQLNINYCQSSPFSVNGTLTQGIDVQSQNSYNYNYKIKIRQFLAEAKFSYVNCGRFRPYGLVGIGPSFNKAYSFSTTVPSLLTFTRTYDSHTTVGFTYAVGAGLDVEITNCVYLGISYRFTNFGRASLGSATIDDTSVSGTLSQSHFYANEVLAQLTFLF